MSASINPPERCGAISTTDLVWSRARAVGCILKTESLRTTRRASAPINTVVVPKQSGNWDRTIERTQTLIALVRSLFSHSGGRRLGFVNFARPTTAAGKRISFSFRSLVQYPQKSDGGRFHTLSFTPLNQLNALLHFAPTWGLVSAAYGHSSTERKRVCPTKEFPITENVFPRRK